MSDDPIMAALARIEAEQLATRTALMARMERIDNSLTDIRDDIGVNMGRADRAQEAAENSRKEVRFLGEQLSLMWRQIKRLETRVREIGGE